MTDITTLSQRLNTRTLHFVLLTLVTCGVWPLLWLYKKQDTISDTTGYPVICSSSGSPSALASVAS